MKRALVIGTAGLALVWLGACVSQKPKPPEKPPTVIATPSPSPTPQVAMSPTPGPTPQNPNVPVTQHGDLPYAKPVPGKPGYVYSPYAPQSYVDVKGFPPGTEVKCPYSGKVFLVP